MLRIRTCLGGASVLAMVASAAAQSPTWQDPGGATGRSGREVFESTCAACHGRDGKGTASAELTKILKLPDFSDCNFRRP